MLIRSVSAPSTSDLMMTSLDHQKRKFLAQSSKPTIPSSSISMSQKRLLFLYSIISILLIMASLILIGYESFQKTQQNSNNSTISKILLYSQTVRSNIERYNASSPHFGNISETFNIVPAYKLVHCEISDDISIIMKNIFCYLYDSDEFIARNSTFLQPNTMCSNLRVRSFNEMIKNVHFKYNVTVFVQNPLSRFLNAYLANCIKKTDSSENACFGCNPGELECVVNQLKSSVNETERHADTQTLMSMAPLTWYCNMPNIYKQAYFVKFPIDHRERSSYLGDVADILLNSEVPQEKVDFIKKTLRENFNDEMSTEENGLRREVIDNFKNNTMLLRSLMEIYREDFEIFDISNPNLEVEDIF